ncbi:hypothetical protein Glove_682g7 [Diversispora epigaea]|uniref:Uncharacterized protein n=1 Tax=Diversispora epigaea TaxID=1348612 RepID=A0A397G6P8_9GLOM|nr:hypothetical protein Glove_682g7 [Diversispora epigaea]
MSRMRNRSIFASVIAGLPIFTISSISSTSSTSRCTRPETKPIAPFVVDERETTRKKIKQIDIKKRLKNIELLFEINKDPDFSKLLEKLQRMQSGIASQIKSAIFEIFGESQFPCIDFQSSLAEIKIWRSKKISNIYIALGITITQLFLNPKIKGIQISENLLKKQMKINFPEDEELEVEETTEEKSKEWEKEKRSSKRRRTSKGCVSSLSFAFSRLASPYIFESSDTSDTIREEDNITDGDTEVKGYNLPCYFENNHRHPIIEDNLHTTITSIANNIISNTSFLIKFTSGFIQPNYVSTIKQVTVKGYNLPCYFENNHRHPIIEDNLHTTITSIANNIISNTSFLIKFTSGFIQPNYVSTIKQVTGSYNKSRDILNTWSNHFRKNFHKNIWRLRCKILIEAEKQHGIINRMKWKPAHIIQIDSNESNNSSNCNNNSNNINNSFNNDSNNNYNNNNNNCINNSFNIIKVWVSKGIKFLGF